MFNPTTKVYFTTMFSRYEDQLNRRQPGLSTPAAANVRLVTNTVTETINQTFTLDQNHRFRDINTQNYAIGGESLVWGGTFDFTPNYSPSKGTPNRFITARAATPPEVRQHRSITHNTLRQTQITGPAVYA